MIAESLSFPDPLAYPVVFDPDYSPYVLLDEFGLVSSSTSSSSTSSTSSSSTSSSSSSSTSSSSSSSSSSLRFHTNYEGQGFDPYIYFNHDFNYAGIFTNTHGLGRVARWDAVGAEIVGVRLVYAIAADTWFLSPYGHDFIPGDENDGEVFRWIQNDSATAPFGNNWHYYDFGGDPQSWVLHSGQILLQNESSSSSSP